MKYLSVIRILLPACGFLAPALLSLSGMLFGVPRLGPTSLAGAEADWTLIGLTALFILTAMALFVSLTFEAYRRFSRFALTRDYPLLNMSLNSLLLSAAGSSMVLCIALIFIKPILMPLLCLLVYPFLAIIVIFSHTRSPDRFERDLGLRWYQRPVLVYATDLLSYVLGLASFWLVFTWIAARVGA